MQAMSCPKVLPEALNADAMSILLTKQGCEMPESGAVSRRFYASDMENTTASLYRSCVRPYDLCKYINGSEVLLYTHRCATERNLAEEYHIPSNSTVRTPHSHRYSHSDSDFAQTAECFILPARLCARKARTAAPRQAMKARKRNVVSASTAWHLFSSGLPGSYAQCRSPSIFLQPPLTTS